MLLARRGGRLAQAYFRSIRGQHVKAWRWLAVSGDVEAFLTELGTVSSVDDRERLNTLLSTATALPKDQLRRVVDAAWARGFPGEGAPNAAFDAARQAGVRNPSIVDRAAQMLSVTPSEPSSSWTYLTVTDPERLWTALSGFSNPPLADRFSQLDVFTWVAHVQDLRPPHLSEGRKLLLRRDLARPVLVVLDPAPAGQALQQEAVLSTGGQAIFNPWLRLVAQSGDAAATPLLVELAEQGSQVETLGTIANASLLFRAYCLWLAADASTRSGTSLEGVRGSLLELLVDNNPALARAAAKAVLADEFTRAK